jgi:hypothetical protein
MNPLRGELGARLDRLWDVLGDRESLFPQLPDDAALARARSGELVEAIPRLLELAIGDGLQRVPVTVPFDLLREADWTTWSAARREAIEDVVDTWWTSTRTAIEPELSPGLVLACLCRLGVPQIRWLGPWLEDLDGPAARHLANVVTGQLPEPEWEGFDDQRSQILAWCRTEPVIIGLTVIGGVHLDEGQLSEALDLML